MGKKEWFTKYSKRALIFLGIAIAVILVVGAVGTVIDATVRAAGGNVLMEWLISPISELKIWHLLVILFLTACAAQD